MDIDPESPRVAVAAWAIFAIIMLIVLAIVSRGYLATLWERLLSV
jgi:hypothetical protein